MGVMAAMRVFDPRNALNATWIGVVYRGSFGITGNEKNMEIHTSKHSLEQAREKTNKFDVTNKARSESSKHGFGSAGDCECVV